MTNTASENQNPLVSIIVITYNSAKYVLETLESTKAQTYQNIELIVTDDCSTDNTVEICRKWLEENKQRFVFTELITVEQNTGIPANCNRGLYVAKGEWIKYIAGDDILMPDCIKSFVAETKLHSDIFFFTCGIYKMKDEIISEAIYAESSFLKRCAKKQFQAIATTLWGITGPSTFMNNAVLKTLNGFEERYRLFEDFPLFLKITSSGYQFCLIDIPLVIYRVHSQSISQISGSSLWVDAIQLYRDEVLIPLLKKKGMFFLWRHYLLHKELISSKSRIAKLKVSIWLRLTDPYTWILKYHKVFYNRKPPAFRTEKIKPLRKSELITPK